MREGFLFILTILVIVFSCRKDDPGISDDNSGSLLAEMSIGPPGGTVSADGLLLTVSPGTFFAEHTIRIYTEKQFSDDFSNHTITGIYRLTGIPADYNGTVSLILSIAGNLSGESYLAHGIVTETGETKQEQCTYCLREVRDSSGYLIATLPDNQGGEDGTGRKGTGNNNTLDLVIMGVTGLTQHQNDFVKIIHPFTEDKSQIIALADAVSEAFETFGTMELVDQDNLKILLGNTRFQVIIPDNAAGSDQIWNMRLVPMRKGPYRPFEIVNRLEDLLKGAVNIDQASLEQLSNEQIKGYAAVWAYRMICYLYLGRDLNWLTFSSASWIYEKFSGLSPLNEEFAEEYMMSPFRGMEAGKLYYGNDTARQMTNLGGRISLQELKHAAGMYPFIKYLMGYYDEDPTLLKRILVGMANEPDIEPAKVIIESTEDPEFVWWPGFFREYLTGSLVNIPVGNFLETMQVIDQIDFYEEKDTFRHNEYEYHDLSAKLYKINFLVPEFEEDAELRLKAGPSSLNLDYVTIMAFGLKDGKLEYFDQASDLVISGIKDLVGNGYRSLLVVVINSASEPPFTGNMNIAIESTLKTRSIDFNWVIAKIVVDARHAYSDGSTEDGIIIYADGKLREGILTNYTFTSNWDVPFGSGRSTGMIELVFDPVDFPRHLTSYHIQETQALYSTTSYEFSGENIDLTGYRTKFGSFSYYRTYPEVCAFFTSVSKTLSQPDGYSYTASGAPICDDDSYIDIKLGYQ